MTDILDRKNMVLYCSTKCALKDGADRDDLESYTFEDYDRELTARVDQLVKEGLYEDMGDYIDNHGNWFGHYCICEEPLNDFF